MRRMRGIPAQELDNGAERQGRFDAFILTPSRRELATAGGARIDLTASEFNLVAAFADRPNRVLSRDAIADLTRKDDWDGFDRSVDTTISRLRRKFSPYTDAAQLF